MGEKARRFLTDLFNAFVANPRQMPPSAQARVEQDGVHRAVTDYLAGMTDRYALQEWQRLFDPFMRT
jgi:dGTPase